MEGEQPHLGDLLTMVINDLLDGMILQVGGGFKLCVIFNPTWGNDTIFQMGSFNQEDQ